MPVLAGVLGLRLRLGLGLCPALRLAGAVAAHVQAVAAVGLVAEALGAVAAGVHEHVAAVLAGAHAQAGGLTLGHHVGQREGGQGGEALDGVGGLRGGPVDQAVLRLHQRQGADLLQQRVDLLGHVLPGVGVGPHGSHPTAQAVGPLQGGVGHAHTVPALVHRRHHVRDLRAVDEPLLEHLPAVGSGRRVEERGEGVEAVQGAWGEHASTVRRRPRTPAGHVARRRHPPPSAVAGLRRPRPGGALPAPTTGPGGPTGGGERRRREGGGGDHHADHHFSILERTGQTRLA